MRPAPRRLRLIGAFAALVAVVAATGCTDPGGAGTAAEVAASTSTSTARPAVVDAQVDRILAAVAGTRSDALEARIDGAELEVRRAALAVHEQVPTSPEPAALAGEQLLAAVPAAGEWPRWFAAAVSPGAGAVPQVLVLVQAGPRDPYRVTATATMLPGAELPALAEDAGIVAPLDAAAGGLLATPADAVAGYAGVLSGDQAAAPATTADVFSDQVLAEQAAERDGVSQYVEYSATHTPRAGALWSLRTADGGALVVGVLDGVRSFAPRGVGVRQPLPPDLAALAGRDEAPRGLDIRTAEVVVLHVPATAAGAATSVALVAGHRGTTAVQLR